MELRALREVEELTPYHLRTASPDLDWKTRFRIIAAKASRNNKNPNVYSKTVAPIRNELIKMGYVEGETFVHEYRVLGYHGNRGQPVYFWLDLFIPSLLLDFEGDGEIWHTFFDTKKRDRRRDALLRNKYGIKVVRLNSYHLRKKRLNGILLKTMEKRKIELEVKRVCISRDIDHDSFVPFL
jgi:hypothetical protein